MSPVPRYLLPDTAAVDQDGQLTIAGIRLTDVAQEGTPVFVFDQQHLVNRMREAVAAFPGGAAYASKAFFCLAMARLAAENGMRIDVVSGGELHVAVTADVDSEMLVLHGNNKSHEELVSAIQMNIGMIVVDSFDEIQRIEEIATSFAHPHPVRVMVRVNPGIEAHTHEYIMTGQDDSKFGFGLRSGQAQAAVDRMRQSPNLFDVVGAHSHIGSLIFETTTFEKEIEVLAPFVTGNGMRELCVGGGLGVPYVTGESAPTITEWGSAIHAAAAHVGLPADVAISAEPGRSIVAPACITLYRVGTIKDIDGIRTYLSVDGGMSENPRPVLYGSGYEAFLPRDVLADRPKVVTIVGKLCESGDLIIRNARVPADTAVGDVIATPVTGAYGFSMASNYNRMPRPAVLFLQDEQVHTVVRRESYDDLIRLEI